MAKNMKIVDVETITFKFKSRVARDLEGHSHPAPEHDAIQTLTKIITDEGVEGYCFGGNKEVMDSVLKPKIIGEAPFDHEKMFQRMWEMQRLHRGVLTERLIAVVNMALWDLVGRYLGQPICKLLGRTRDKVKAYASTMCGDAVKGGLSTPAEYADFAETCLRKGYTAFKIHPWKAGSWNWAPNPKMDVECCKAVRERIGEDMVLMLDGSKDYNREQALYVGRELEKLNFFWFEEPMLEYNVASYAWLCQQLEIPVVGPEVMEGLYFTRAEWILRGACDICRYDANMGGVTALKKTANLCEAHGMRLAVHLGSTTGNAANLQVLGSMGRNIPGEFYERGLLHPNYDYEKATSWLKKTIDPMDSKGYVHVSQKPGLGMEIDWSFIEENIIKNEEIEKGGKNISAFPFS
jgi:L-alanine-DL-glutamate epimerase-like enolase superfamily enzyme